MGYMCVDKSYASGTLTPMRSGQEFRLAHSAGVYNLHGTKRLVTIPNVLSAEEIYV